MNKPQIARTIRLKCWVLGCYTKAHHEFSDIVTCDRCGRKIQAWYDFLNCGYNLVKEAEQECKCPTCKVTNERLELIDDD